MMRKILMVLITSFVACAGSSSAFAGYDEGLSAYKQGDYAKALMEWRPLAEAGDAAAQSGIGTMYAQGNGVPQDFNEAVKWFRLAADKANASAQFGLGNAYASGHGVTKDYTEAEKWFLSAAKQGNASAQFYVGAAYAHGYGVTKNNTEAVKWYRLAADNGVAGAQSNLGMIYAQGVEMKQSTIVAYALFSISATVDSSESNTATANRSIIQKKMTPSQIKEAKSLTDRMSKPGALLKELDAYIGTQSP